MSRRFTYGSTLEAVPERVWDWHSRPGALERLMPPWDRVQVLRRTGSVADGDRTEIELRAGPFTLAWLAEHKDSDPGRGFTDWMVRGPFASWTHRHGFDPVDPDRCRLTDDIEYRVPGGSVGQAVAGSFVDERLSRTFAYRHRVTASDLDLHERYFGDRPARFLVSGSTGLVGTALTALLSAGGHHVTRLSRGEGARPDPLGASRVEWDPVRGVLNPEAVSGHDVVVHLAGENVAGGLWTEERKARIRDSRVNGTQLLSRALAATPHPPEVLVCASAVGFYGDRGNMEVDEGSAAGSGFLAETGVEWEQAADAARQAGIRVVHLRIGIVLTPAGGALARMLPPFRMGVGGPLGSGRQFWSWIAIDDLLGAILHVAASDHLDGPVNAVAPEHVRNAEFSATLGRVLRRPAIMPAPAAALRLLLGEMADEMLLGGAQVLSSRLLESGFTFRYPDLEGALRHLLGRTIDGGSGVRE